MENQKAQVRAPATMSEKFKWLKALLRDSELSASSKNVATALMTFHNDRTGQCNPSQKRLAEAVGLSRRRVNGLVAELRAEGWIEAEGTLGASDYRLVLDRAASATETGDGVELDVPPTSDLTYPYVSSDVPPTSSLTYPYVKPDTQNHTENRPEEPQRETTHPTTAPSAVASELEVIGPAEVNAAMPDRSETAPSMAANDNVRQEEGETFFGWTIPADIMRQWLAAFPHANVRGELMRRAEWYVANVPEERRVRVFTGKLREADDKGRQAQLTRQENRQADVQAGVVGRDVYGRPIRKPEMGWIERPRAFPPGADRYWTPPNYGDEIVFRGKGWSLTKKKLDEGTGRWPAIDFKAAVTAFDTDHASAEVSEIENRNAFAAFCDARQAEAMAA